MSGLNILVAGGDGRLGRALRRTMWPSGVLVHFMSRAQLDVSCPNSVAAAFGAQSYGLVINAAAYTDVERAEEEVGAAFRVNACGPAVLAEAARHAGAKMIHVSTDFVFDGEGPHREEGVTAPCNVYGASKRAGELAVLSGLQDAVILRTAWLFDADGPNFVTSMLKRASAETVSAVTDEQGSPTAVGDLARAIVCLVESMLADGERRGGRIMHFANQGWATRYELAEAAFDVWAQCGQRTPRLLPVLAAEFAAKAKRPKDSRLDCDIFTQVTGLRSRPWRAALEEVVMAIARRERGAGS
ncbi:dTDP-4-dehydrorhamnose reductase [uncultured Brevundimonas sp.]|nr:dTDP-4-dehydrorhamnose reductase [uncultured Brevundimonas sp.]